MIKANIKFPGNISVYIGGGFAPALFFLEDAIEHYI